ncbi:MAG: hypothetical protein H7A32_01510 [Deltaproteobacteria bacterium]|nr:hypothetical protein [Deltaproteobacteria bacterium]
MNNPGQSNQSGIFAQDWAAISLFMQYLGYESFDYIHLEAPKFQDFNLVFKDGHKVICESKARKRAFSFSNLKKILANLLQKDCVSFNDEVLIICLKVSPELKEAIKFVEYDSLFNKKIFTQKKFSSAEIKLLPQVKFWEATPAFNEKLAYNLFTDFVAPKFWLPKRRLEDIVNTIFVKEIFEKSTKGAKFFKRDILNRINKRVDDIVDDESKYDEEQVSIVKKLKAHKVKLYAQHKLSNNDVAFISTNPAIHSFVLNEIEKKKNIELKKNDSLWLASKKLGFFGKVIGIFIKNINHNDNAQYIIEFIKKNITNLHGFYSIDFFKIEAIKLTRKILELDQSYIDDAYEIVEKILSDNTRDFFYIRNNSRINYEKKEVCKLLIIINESARPSLKTQIYKFITKTFNLITDSNGHEHYTPSDIFSIVKDYLIKPFDQTESRVLAFTQVISDQFDAFYKRYDEKFCFEGWEEIGSTSVSVGDTYTVVDRNFVHCIEGALKSYYEEDSQRAWKFIKENCISTEKKEINKGRPDFLSRAVISIILKRYQDKNLKVSNEAFEILKKFILFRKGIPSKAELIYQQIRRKENEFSNDQKWKLINIYLEEFKIPSTPTVENSSLRWQEMVLSKLKKN